MPPSALFRTWTNYGLLYCKMCFSCSEKGGVGDCESRGEMQPFLDSVCSTVIAIAHPALVQEAQSPLGSFRLSSDTQVASQTLPQVNSLSQSHSVGLHGGNIQTAGLCLCGSFSEPVVFLD